MGDDTMSNAHNSHLINPEEYAQAEARATAFATLSAAAAQTPFTSEQEARIAEIVAQKIHESTFKHLSQANGSDPVAAQGMADRMKSKG